DHLHLRGPALPAKGAVGCRAAGCPRPDLGGGRWRRRGLPARHAGQEEVRALQRDAHPLRAGGLHVRPEQGHGELRHAPHRALTTAVIEGDQAGRGVTVQRRFADGVLTPFPKTERSRRRVPLTARALAAYKRLPPRLDTALFFPAPRGGYVSLDNFRTRDWYDALDAAGIERRGPYHLRHTFATGARAARVSSFALARVMGASVKEIDRTYGHLARDSEDSIRARLDARAERDGAEMAFSESGE